MSACGPALAIGAHPDDLELGCGTTLAKLITQNVYVRALAISCGKAGTTPGGCCSLRKWEHPRTSGMSTHVGGASEGTYYVPRITVRFRHTRYNVEDRGESFGNLLSIRLRNLRGVGHTQLWLGQGTWLHEYEWLPETQEGKVRSLTLRRYQPITRRTALGLAIGSVSYDTRAADYTSAHANLNVTYSW